jgi:hypothetical protein
LAALTGDATFRMSVAKEMASQYIDVWIGESDHLSDDARSILFRRWATALTALLGDDAAEALKRYGR